MCILKEELYHCCACGFKHIYIYIFKMTGEILLSWIFARPLGDSRIANLTKSFRHGKPTQWPKMTLGVGGEEKGEGDENGSMVSG